MASAAVQDIAIHYEVQGKGAPLLLLMGVGGSGALWGSEFLAELAANFRLIIPDHRGAGLTARGAAAYTLDRLALDAVAVLDAEGVLAAHVFGMSIGGMVAQLLAAEHPARVRGLVLGGTTAGGVTATPPRRSALETLQRRGLLGVNNLLVSPDFLARRTGLLTRLAVRAMARPTAPAVLAEQLAAVAGFDMSARLHEIVAPALVVTGDLDLLIPPENSRLLARGILHARGVSVKGAGHCFFWEAPDRAAAALAEFLLPLSTITTLTALQRLPG